ncbi:hypothetical protein C1M53_05010 [Mesorhizobium sp. Pch-S]|nr:hypothetical protein C1M53_05010 [Mesorhizobium sp. Pch-S]
MVEKAESAARSQAPPKAGAMVFLSFLLASTALISAAAIAIAGWMPFPPLAIWVLRMIVILVAGMTIYAGLQVQ